MTSRTTITIPSEVHEALKRGSFALGLSVGDAASQAIEDWSKKNERQISDALSKLVPKASRGRS